VPEAHVGRQTAKEAKAADGDTILVESPSGSLKCTLRITDAIRPGVISIYEGWWEKLGGSVNRLTSDRLSDKGLSATYNDVRCRFTPV
jgi:anaerobic selenocysteine-containing dehydrogenase